LAQHLARLGADRWHAAGFRGQGIRVAVLDAGFRGYKECLGKFLPGRVTARSFRHDGNLEARDSQHGVLCAEVVHALAPDAELLLANWDSDCPEQFLAAVRWARQQGAQVLSCSLIMPSWSDGEGGGAINDEVARLVGKGAAPGDMLCFASAGNTALRHWSGAFQPNQDDLHLWRPGQTVNTLKPWGNERVAVELYGQAAAPFEIVVKDAASGELVGRSLVKPVLPGSEAGSAIVRFLPRTQHTYQVQVRCTRSPETKPDARFHLVALGGTLQYCTHGGSISCPADGPGVVAVGAVDEHGRRLFYSSCGPNSRLPKPDLVAEVPFPSCWRSRGFTGTSAAAPQAAGVAALCWSRHRDLSADQVRSAILAAACDLGPPGHDCETGFGRIALPSDLQKHHASH
jgi:subtilisin family serine protease